MCWWMATMLMPSSRMARSTGWELVLLHGEIAIDHGGIICAPFPWRWARRASLLHFTAVQEPPGGTAEAERATRIQVQKASCRETPWDGACTTLLVARV